MRGGTVSDTNMGEQRWWKATFKITSIVYTEVEMRKSAIKKDRLKRTINSEKAQLGRRQPQSATATRGRLFDSPIRIEELELERAKNQVDNVATMKWT